MSSASGDSGASRRSRRSGGDPTAPAPDPASDGAIIAPGTTGRYLVLMDGGAVSEGVDALTKVAGLRMASTADFKDSAVSAPGLAGAQGLVFHEIGVAVVNTPPDQYPALNAAAAGGNAILAIEPERVVYALPDAAGNGATVPADAPVASTDLLAIPAVGLPRVPPPPVAQMPIEYLLGYRDAVNFLVDTVLATAGLADHVAAAPAAPAPPAAAFDESLLTWGLQVTNVAASHFSGKGIKVAVLDTGFDLGHPDFAGRNIVSQSFVTGEPVQDGHGHGTRCIGTACGPRQPGTMPRYGIAYDADIYVGKVLGNQGSGADANILAGINWAITNGCVVVSMSLGSPVGPGQSFSQVYEHAARRALERGTMIVAAAGNESHRPADIQPVSHPANCPSIYAVAALGQDALIAFFSDGGINPQGGQVDFAAPGVQIRSGWPRPQLYNTISGTSMATPHVAGIAALLAEAHPTMRGRALANLLGQTARRLTVPSRDVGAGLVQAP